MFRRFMQPTIIESTYHYRQSQLKAWIELVSQNQLADAPAIVFGAALISVCRRSPAGIIAGLVEGFSALEHFDFG